jgi:FkbM family methyltransferase
MLKDNLRSVIRKYLGEDFFQSVKIFLNYFKFYKNIYYSQFGEDVVLRVLVGDKIKNGFYVDIGAYHPRHLSNTYYFYKKGWKGINIDANQNSIRAFKMLRPRDINVNAAISDKDSDGVTFYSWNSVYDTISLDEAEIIRKKIGPEKAQYKIPSLRLESVLDKYFPAGQSLDILNVDAEGCDLEVLKSNNWDKYKPKFIIVEDHRSDIREIMNSEKVRFLESHGYKLSSWTCISLVFSISEPEAKGINVEIKLNQSQV